MYHAIIHPWRTTPSGDALTLVLDAAKPSLHLARLGPDAAPEPGDVVEPSEVMGSFTLHRSPDERVPKAAQSVAQVIAEVWPPWLEKRILELMNGIGGLGRTRGAGSHRAAMRTMDRNAPDHMDHPLAPLGIWGPHVESVQRQVHKVGRFERWSDVSSRLDPVLVQGIRDSVPDVLVPDILGLSQPRMLVREPL